MEIGRDMWSGTALDVGWLGRRGDKIDVCFLDDWKHVVQFTEVGKVKKKSWFIKESD